ncbi:MAG: hypothetical protein KDN20_04720 [Verrucomicrobiae bacterium]|nr:hypothetical protein [Verrucomicrobiae bacterium]
MKTLRRFDFSSGALGLLFALLVSGVPVPALALPIAGANGKSVDFAGVKSAGPGGLTVQIQADGASVEVSWEKLDLVKLEADHPDIFAAYQKALTGSTTSLDLGSFAPAKAPVEMAKVTGGAKSVGWYETKVGQGRFVIQLPNGEPRGVLLIAQGQDGESLRFLGPGRSRWSDFAGKFQFAVMAYEFLGVEKSKGEGVLKEAEFVQAEKGSGEAVLKALEVFAKDSGKAILATAPITVFGSDVLGSAFAYNFTQSFPDRVLATVVSKGAFYVAAPTEASAKVPLLIIWGEYNQDIEVWEPIGTHEEIYPNSLGLRPNWAYAMEPRGTGGETPFSFKLAMTFLDRLTLARLSKEGEIQELDRSRAWVGNLETFEISRMEEPDKALEPTQTWLPDGEIAKLWEDFLNGRMQLDTPK